MELPPLFGDFSSKLEKNLCRPDKLPIHKNLGPNRLIPREPDISSLFSIDVIPLQTTIKVVRDPSTGELLGYKEDILDSAGQTAKNSTSMKRAPGASEEALRGSSTNYPFWPGGLEETDIPQLNDKLAGDIDFENDLLTVPPGFTHGMEFTKNKSPPPTNLKSKANHTIMDKMLDLSSIFSFDDLDDEWWSDLDQWNLAESKKRKEEQRNDVKEEMEEVPISRTHSLENLTQVEVPSFFKKSSQQETEEKWAFLVDVNIPVADFSEQINDPAYKWPFELDNFQKQAVLHLENHESVFVAAHTSAGKTVVAEYAIALSARHMTRTIYTSPIKALSNQKFRDFKQTFKDVGLLTGDVQISPEAQCLIMTTEILRSMLYNGADTIRDLEWVIFDEVHYINDSERGVVWEEVLIMLPDHVSIILLSATVPNCLEFADWVGKTKKKKIYVISTLKRPVPLEHFIYTGNSKKTSNECFLIVGAEGTFLSKGYNEAIAAKKARVTKSSAQFGPKGTRSGDPRQDKGVWLSVIDHLKKNNLLPVVAFTFSKRKCDKNAVALSSVDLTTQTEKSEIHIFFQKCISRLKGSDRQLPQVLHMQEILKKGVGVHHSGILPILKEVIEMLFQRGLVKLLFATETFAMGVNMPARTVVFDSLRKHDGTNYRALQPGEYIQMAGRAGRRGLDSTGTVIILCKGDVPETSELHNIILGKPTKLESQFRLTYGMMLNLLRVEKLRVEDMMKRSFSEFHTQKNVNEYKAELEQLNMKLAKLKTIECSYCGDIETFYLQHKEYAELHAKLQNVVMSHPQIGKVMSSGRVVIVQHKSFQKQAGVILKSSSSNKGKKFSVLLLCEREEENECGDSSAVLNKSTESHISELVNMTDLYLPEGPSSHKVVEILNEHVKEITTEVLKIACDKVLDDYNKRQIPRFRNDPVGQSANKATQDLLHLVESNVQGIPVLDPVKDLGINDIDTVEEFMYLTKKRESLGKHDCLKCPQFDAHFKLVKSNMKIKEEAANINWLLSDNSLQLLPEYIQRLEVLKTLRYIDDTDAVKLKGRVACEISNNELIITELIFENVFSHLHPEEIAALLSCMVFEEKRCAEPKLVSSLEKGMNKIKEIAENIGLIQKQCGMIEPVDSFVGRFKFGLVEVVYEWARGMPFNQIATLADVTEGIIVRTIQRLDETLRDVRNAARLVGDPVLCQKMEESSTLIKRDIVFAASLYTV